MCLNWQPKLISLHEERIDLHLLLPVTVMNKFDPSCLMKNPPLFIFSALPCIQYSHTYCHLVWPILRDSFCHESAHDREAIYSLLIAYLDSGHRHLLAHARLQGAVRETLAGSCWDLVRRHLACTVYSRSTHQYHLSERPFEEDLLYLHLGCALLSAHRHHDLDLFPDHPSPLVLCYARREDRIWS